MCVLSAHAQQSKTDESVEFRPYWDIQLQGGASYTVGESSKIGDLLSPSLYLSTNYRFHHAMGVRFGLGGWQGRGFAVLADKGYAFKFLQLNADYKLDMCGIFGGYNHRRVVNPYLLAGVGFNYGFNNKQANAIVSDSAAEFVKFAYLWDSKFFVAGRFGVGIDFRVGERVMLNLEANANVLSDKFNSKRADNVDWQMNFLAGVSYSFGKKTATSQKWVEEQEALKAAELARQQQEAAEAETKRKAAEEAERKAAEEAARLRAEQEAAAEAVRLSEIRQANVEQYSEEIFFTIGSYVIRKAEGEKITRLAKWLNENLDYRVAIVGYADKETGTTAGNLRLSERRAEAVKAALVKAGVDVSRMDFAFYGDKEQPFAQPHQNRVVICTLQ
jgi:outer membrane protein OmpA-like peptidoglycan-associated protein